MIQKKSIPPDTGTSLSGKKSFSRWLIIAVLTFILIATVVFMSMIRHTTDAESTPQVFTQPQTILRIHGSNTLGASLLPMSAEQYLGEVGSLEVHRIPQGSEVEVHIQGQMDGSHPQTIEIEAHGTSTGFKGLIDDHADIAASSRKVTSPEIHELGRLGYGVMTSHTNEHVVALDGVAMIVHPQNPIDRLTVEQIARIFTGDIRNWSELGGEDRAISLYARDDKSGTFDTFRALVLGNSRKLSNWTLRFEDSIKMNDMIMKDLGSIGFIGLPYILSAKPLAVSDRGSGYYLPTYATVKSESYALSRRLYLYTSEFSENHHVRDFISFIQSDEGQKLVRAANLVDLSLTPNRTEIASLQGPERYQELVRNAEFVVTVRFKPGENVLDNRGKDDLNRFLLFMNERENRNREVMLIGHTDILGDADVNRELSLERAAAIKKILAEDGVIVSRVEGFGEELPVAGNDSPEGRQRNRRVEIFLGG